MKYKKFLFYLIAISLSSCVYYPHLTNIPLMEEDGELQVNAGAGMSPVNASVFYSPLNHLSVFTRGSSAIKINQ